MIAPPLGRLLAVLLVTLVPAMVVAFSVFDLSGNPVVKWAVWLSYAVLIGGLLWQRRGFAKGTSTPLAVTSDCRVGRSPDDVRARLLTLVGKTPGWTLVEVRREERVVLEARTRSTLHSFGEVVTVKLAPAGEGATGVEVTSEPIVDGVDRDWGKKNRRNVDRVVRALSDPPDLTRFWLAEHDV